MITDKDIEKATPVIKGIIPILESTSSPKEKGEALSVYIASEVSRIRAEAAEEARKEAADRAVEWVISKGGHPYDERYEFDIDPRTFEDELRAAIFKEATE